MLAKRLGRSRADIAHPVRLLDLPDQAIRLIDTGALTKGHGKALLTEPDHDRRRALAERGWSVRTLEAEIARPDHPRHPAQPPGPDQSAAATRLQDAVIKATGCEVHARPHRSGFQIILDQAAADRLAQTLDGENYGT